MDHKNHDFTSLEYLLHGNETQREVYDVLNSLRIMDLLRPYNPILVGTIPIDIHVRDSDLDIICEVHDFERFTEIVTRELQQLADYRHSMYVAEGVQSSVTNFVYRRWAIEIFAQPIPTRKQRGYRHMVVEHRILQLLGAKGYEIIRAWKRNGLKTEPAFAKLLQLEGDPYEALLDLENWDDTRLLTWLDVVNPLFNN